MADWTGAGVPTRELYLTMAERELHGVSPSYEALCRAVAGSPQVCALLDGLPGPKRQPNLLLAAVRYLEGPVAAPGAFLAFVVSRWDQVAATIMARRTQTNEPGRCATLLPVLAALPQPLALLEVGASAGLCLYPDRYAYHYTRNGTDHRLGESAVVLSCAVTGPVPLPDRLPQVAWRAGLDLNPLHAERTDDRRWLASLIWPEQADRADRLDRAAVIAAAEPARILAGDLLVDLPDLVAEAPQDATLVVFHSAVLAYLGPEDRHRFTDVLGQLRQNRPVEWVANEGPGVVPGVNVPDVYVPSSPQGRFVLAHNQRAVALAGPHGHTLDWLPEGK